MTPPNPSEAAREAARAAWTEGSRRYDACFQQHSTRNFSLSEAIIEATAEAIQSALDSALTAERERRIAAEEIVDMATWDESWGEIDWVKNDVKNIVAAANEYRTKFPKGDDHG